MNATRIEDILIGSAILLLVSVFAYRYWVKKPAEAQTDEGLGIAKLIEDVKSELITSDENRRSQGLPALFQVRSFDLEINFVVKARRKGQVGIDYEVVAVGGESEVSSEKVQKIVLHMDAASPENIPQRPNLRWKVRTNQQRSATYRQTNQSAIDRLENQ